MQHDVTPLPLPLPILSDEEVARSRPAGDEAGVGTLVTERGNLPLEAIRVDAQLVGLLAQVVLTQTFVNQFDLPLQATYVFPLPDRAAVTEFRMEVGDRVVEGVLRERGEARAAYEQAVAEGRRAAIAEEERPGVFTMRVGNLMPGERARVRLAMVGPLPYDQGEATFRFPLVVAPRYIPGTPLGWEPAGDGVQPDTGAVPDASRITPPVLLPGFPNPVRLEISAGIDPGGLEIGAVRSSLHAAVVEELEGSSGPVRLVKVEPGERPNRDFVLRLAIGSADLGASLVAAPDERDEQDRREGRGTFLLTLVPPVAGDAARPRDVALVLDRSGSMAGWKMVAARRAVARMVDSLCERDRFTLLAFDHSVESPPVPDGAAMQPGSDRNRFRAVEFLSGLGARGGTEMAAPLVRALDRLGADPGRDRVLVLVTDGQVGNEDEILRLLRPRLGDVRVYTVGIDTAVNEGFLKRLATVGGGACELVESEDRLDEVLDRVRQRIGTPVVTDLELDAEGLRIEPDSVTPPRLPALLAGAPLVVAGRYRGRPEGALRLSGRDATGGSWRVVVPAAPGRGALPGAGAAPAGGVLPSGGVLLAKVWARAHLRDLEDRYASDTAHDDALERRIVRTSLEFGVLSRFTAFVALDTVVVNRDGRLHRVIQPVDVPQGWELAGLAGLASGAEGVATAAAMTPGILSADAFPDAGPAAARAAMPLRRPAVELPGLKLPPTRQPAGDRSGRRFWRSLAAQRAEKEKEPAAAGADLDAYRRRAGDLVRQLEAAPGTELGRRLGTVAVEVAALVVDLESVGADPRELEPLRDLVAELAGPGTQPTSDQAELSRRRDRAIAVLRTFARDHARSRAPRGRNIPMR